MLEASHLAQIMKHASHEKLKRFIPFLEAAMTEFEIGVNLQRSAAFIAQLAHESGEFRFMEEIWGPTAAQRRYEPVTDLSKRLGNSTKGDGARFKGRGPIQITGRSNYERYGGLLGLDLVSDPDVAASPEVGFRVAGLYWSRNGLNERADVRDFEGITKRINGGLNGQSERLKYYELGLQVLAGVFPATVPSKSARKKGAGELLERGAEAIRKVIVPDRKRNSVKRRFDARHDTLDFRDLMYVPTLVEVPTHVPLGNYLDWKVPILDQGREGACTGFGLATVVNYLLLRRRVIPDPVPVSARMLYDMARRYDEWPGEKYDGSSARGAMKGWHKHGVCREEIYLSTGPRIQTGLTDERTSEARRRPLGAYFRVNHKDVVAMHSAIAEVGILYATCMVHEGWDNVESDGVIRLSDRILGGHAFAIVAYDEYGFWLQNSWGSDWGSRGFARISYDDWLRNGTDVWVARLGAPVTIYGSEATAQAIADSAGQSAAYAYADLRPHLISVGNNGELKAGGDYGSTPEDLKQIFTEDIPRVTAAWKKRRILLYAHGGLVGASAAAQRLADYRPALLGGEVYPLAFIWRTDYWTTLTNILQDAMRRRRPEGVLDAAKDFMLDRLDDALEPVARALTGKRAWDEMKGNALLASSAGGAARLVVDHLKKLDADGDAEIHLVAHSAGSIFMAPLIGLLAKRGLRIASCTLWAPACTYEEFERSYLPAIDKKDIERFSLYMLGDKVEQDDHCAHIYNKSLLYLVSNAFELQPRIPGFRDGVPILGLERCMTPELRRLLQSKQHRLVVAPMNGMNGRSESQAQHHGDFDDDAATVASTFAHIIGADGAGKADASVKIEKAAAMMTRSNGSAAQLKFIRSSSSLRERRETIDARTRLR